MKIYIKTLTGEVITLLLDPLDTILIVKTMIYYKKGIPLDSQRAIAYPSKLLQDDLTLSDYKIQKESTLFLLLKLYGC